MNLGKGVEIRNKKLSILRPILNQWIKNVTKYCSTPLGSEYDAPYWYNERATVSTFAGAIWNIGGIPLEEYQAVKWKERRKRKGRIDLWFYWSKKQYVAEIKQLWFKYNEHRIEHEFIQRVNEKIAQALTQVSEIPKSEGKRLGIVFIVPSIYVYFKSDNIDWQEQVFKRLNQIDYDILAWVFPKSAKELAWHCVEYPGVALVIRALKGKSV